MARQAAAGASAMIAAHLRLRPVSDRKRKQLTSARGFTPCCARTSVGPVQDPLAGPTWLFPLHDEAL